MATNKLCQLIILDNSELFKLLTALIKSWSIPLIPSGAGFAQGYQFTNNNTEWHILKLPSENSARIAWLSVIDFSRQRTIDRILGIASAQSLDNHLRPGDLALVHTASVLPYPALYKSSAAYSSHSISSAEHYHSNANFLQQFGKFIELNLSHITWQDTIPTVHCAGVKNPLSEGSLLPWAPEQYDQLRGQGVDTISDFPSGMYEAQDQLPETEIICINYISSTPSPASRGFWQRHQKQLHCAVIELLTQIMFQPSNSCQH